MYPPKPRRPSYHILSIQRPLLPYNLYLVTSADWTIVLTRVRAEVDLLIGRADILTHSATPRHAGDQRLLALRTVEEGSSTFGSTHARLIHVTMGSPWAS